MQRKWYDQRVGIEHNKLKGKDVAKIWYDLLEKICSRTKHIDSVEYAFADLSCIFV